MIDANKAQYISSKKNYDSALETIVREINRSISHFRTNTKILVQSFIYVDDWIIDQIMTVLDLKGFDLELLSNGDLYVSWGHCNVTCIPKDGFKQFKTFDELSAVTSKENTLFKIWKYLEEQIVKESECGRQQLYFSSSINNSTRDVLVKELEYLGYKISLRPEGSYNSFIIFW